MLEARMARNETDFSRMASLSSSKNAGMIMSNDLLYQTELRRLATPMGFERTIR
jgi:hypothetical protein